MLHTMTYVNANNHTKCYVDKTYVEHKMYVSDLIFRSVGPLGIYVYMLYV